MDNKISTSVQYQFTNVYLFDTVFKRWGNFNQDLTKGQKYMRDYLCQEWNTLRDTLLKNDNIVLKDANKEVSPLDFDITINYTSSGKIVFFFNFPDYEFNDAASKFVALALMNDMPRYFTLEYSEDPRTHERKYVVGEFLVEDGKKKHINYGIVDNERMSYFAGFVMGILDRKED